jgi:hypothetical protein
MRACPLLLRRPSVPAIAHTPAPRPPPPARARPGGPAARRRFQPVHVMEPDERSTLDILMGLKERYERHHKCVYSEEARSGRGGRGRGGIERIDRQRECRGGGLAASAALSVDGV